MERVNFGAMSVWLESAGAVLTLDFRGVVTPVGLTAFCAYEPYMADPAYAMLALFDMAILAITAESLTAPFQWPAMKDKLKVPGAIFCREADYPLFDEHSRQSAALGVVRAAFTCRDQAVAWSRERASAARLAELARLRASSPFRLRA